MIRVTLCALIASAFLAAPSSAQVPPVPPQVDDGFVNTSVGQDCCLFATPTIPGASDFPSSFTLNGQYAIIDDCQVVADEPAPVTVSIFPHPGPMTNIITNAPVGMPACDELVFSITVGGGVQMTLGPVPTSTFARTDLVIGKFTRTWLTPATSQDPPRQFWRYLVSGDAKFTTSSNPALVPACHDVTPPVFPPQWAWAGFWGHIDLSCRDVGGAPDWQISLSLTHHDGCLSHLDVPANPRGIPGAPSAKHVGRSYHFVAPDDFSWLAPGPPAGLDFATTIESYRSTVSHNQSPIAGAPAGNPYGINMGPVCLLENTIATVGMVEYQFCQCHDPDDDLNPMTRAMSQIGAEYCVAPTTPGHPCNTAPFSFPLAIPAPSPIPTANNPWTTIVLASEIPTGFSQHHLGRWNGTARADVQEVQLFSCVGTIQHRDRHNRRFGVTEEHVVFGVNTIYELATLQNRPLLFSAAFTDMLLDFGNQVDRANDHLQAGEPGYTNIVWMISR